MLIYSVIANRPSWEYQTGCELSTFSTRPAQNHCENKNY